MSKVKYLVVIEPTANGYSAYSPDLPGCVSNGLTPQEAHANIQMAVEFHLEGLRLDGAPLPQPRTVSSYVEISALWFTDDERSG